MTNQGGLWIEKNPLPLLDIHLGSKTGIVMEEERRLRKWNEDRPEQAYELALMGATEEQMARVMGINVATLELWKRTRPLFRQRMEEGKEVADAHVAASLYKRAVGFTVPEVHLFMYRGKIIERVVDKYYPPESWAANKWLSLRQRKNWSETIRVETTQTNININKLDLTGVTNEQLRLLRDIGLKQQLALHDQEN